MHWEFSPSGMLVRWMGYFKCAVLIDVFIDEVRINKERGKLKALYGSTPSGLEDHDYSNFATGFAGGNLMFEAIRPRAIKNVSFNLTTTKSAIPKAQARRA